MISSNTRCYDESLENVKAVLTDKDVLHRLLVSNLEKDAKVKIYSDINDVISGVVESALISKYFMISLEKENSISTRTKVTLEMSTNEFEFTEECKQIKNTNNRTVYAAVISVAILIPIIIFAVPEMTQINGSELTTSTAEVSENNELKIIVITDRLEQDPDKNTITDLGSIEKGNRWQENKSNSNIGKEHIVWNISENEYIFELQQVDNGKKKSGISSNQYRY